MDKQSIVNPTAKNKEDYIKAWKSHLKDFYRLYPHMETKDEQSKFLQTYESMMELIYMSAHNTYGKDA